jgi:DNA-binding GntR family transcriptional regulator
VHPDAPIGLVEDHVGERASDIDADSRPAHLRFEISNCIAGEHRANCRRMEAQAPTISPLEDRESVEQRVAQTLRDLIVDGQLPAGTPLVQRDLAQQLGVSPTPVRAGLSQLEREGFVAVTPTGRAIVSRLTREDFEEIYAARLGLEGLAANLGARAVARNDIGTMKETLRDLRRLAEAQDAKEYLRLRWEFHATCYRASGRERLVDEVGRLYWRAYRYHQLVLSTAERFRESVGRYRDFLAACEAGDGARAEQVVQESIRWAVERAAPGVPSESENA